MGQRILLVGANGFVGSHIARTLIGEGHAVSGFGGPMTVDLVADLASSMTVIHGDLRDAREVDAVMERSRPEAVIWSAGYNTDAQGLLQSGETAPEDAMHVNVLGWANVLRAAQRFGVKRVLAAGSTVVFGTASLYADTRIDERAAMRPATVYGLTKAMAEQAAGYYRDRHGLAVTTLRLPLVFGPGRWYGGAASALSQLLDRAAPGVPMNCSAPIDRFDLIYVKDAAKAFALAVAATGPLDAVYHVNGFTTTYPAIILTLKNLVPDFQVHFAAVAAANVYPLMDSDKAARELGFRPDYDLLRALQEYLDKR
jgi:UDP-glucose 4-epimerase